MIATVEIGSRAEVDTIWEAPAEITSGSWMGSPEISPYTPSRPEDWGQPPARDYFFRVEGDILRGQFMQPRPEPSSALTAIRARQPQILRRASEFQEEHGDPIQFLASLLGGMPGRQEDWEALIDEPY